MREWLLLLGFSLGTVGSLQGPGSGLAIHIKLKNAIRSPANGASNSDSFYYALLFQVHASLQTPIGDVLEPSIKRAMLLMTRLERRSELYDHDTVLCTVVHVFVGIDLRL